MSQPIISPRHRHSTRIRGYDYTATGWYFVTICAMNRECLFGEVRNGSEILNEMGRLAVSCWEALPVHFPRVTLDTWVLMPNHLHGILVIKPLDIDRNDPAGVGAQHAAPPSGRLLNQDAFLEKSRTPRLEVKAGSLGAVMRSFKGASTSGVNRLRGFRGPSVWQRNYHDHVIRNAEELNRIRQYILNNPREWEMDPENPALGATPGTGRDSGP